MSIHSTKYICVFKFSFFAGSLDGFNRYITDTSGFQVLTGVFTVFLNSYILVAICVESELRCLSMYPIGLQVFCDIWTGFAFARDSLRRIVIGKHINSIYEYTLFGLNAYLPTPIQQINTTLLLFCRDKLNFYSTGLCIALIAIERYVLICWPFHAKQVLTKKNKVMGSVGLTITIIAASLRYFVCWTRPSEETFRSFLLSLYPYLCLSGKREALLDIIIFFVIPALSTIFMYLCVGLKLRKAISNQERNRDLTIAFFLSCVSWVVLWLPKMISETLQIFRVQSMVSLFNGELSNVNMVVEVLMFVDSPLFLLNPFINPIIFIFVCRDFQKPMKKLWGKLRNKTR